MKRYTLAVTDPKYWSEIHGSLIVDSNNDGIPDRQITCSDSKEHSPTRGTYELTEEEAAEIANHPHVKWIELSPTDNPDNYPKPQPATKRFRKNVKIYRDLNGGYGPTSSPTAAEIGRTNWALKRVGIHSNGDFWPVTSYTGNIQSLNGDTSYSLSGKNVDLVIHDSGVMQYHPEFIDGNGKSRVRDIVLDGPYYIDPDYFNSNNYTYVKMDGRIGITTTSAHNWWENSSLRSAEFSSAGTVWISSNYTVNRSMGDVGTTNALTSGHGTGAAGVSAGNNFGLAFEANIWNMPGISDNVGMGPEANYDLMKIFHKYKPINPETGVKNPTLVNGSWGHQAGFEAGDTVWYKFRGIGPATFTGGASVTNQVTAMKEGLNNQVLGAYRSWSSSSRSNSTDTAANEMMAEGVIYVAAAGNNNQRMGIGRSDPDRLNYMEDHWFNVGDPRSEFPGLACPCNHRDWMNPQGIGFDEENDYHPVICVGCVDEYVDPSTKQERKASYSNNGPGIDIWGFGDEALSAGLSGDSDYEDFPRYSSSGPTYYDCLYNGTSSAAPTIAGLIALYLETNPTADSRDVKKWLNNHASRIVDDGEYQDVQPDDTTTAYWTGGYNMRGAEKRLPIDPYASDAIPSIKIMGSGGLNTLKITSISTNPTKGASVAPTAWASGTEAENNIWRDVAYGNGRFVAVSSDGTNRVMSSLNGIDWTTHLVNTIPWYAVIYANNKFVAVASGNSNTNRVMYSSTGTSWTSTSLQDENSFTMYDNCIAYGAGKFVIVGAQGADRIRYSTTGTSWTKGSASENSGWRGIAYGNGYFVSTAVTGTNRVMRSTNGTNWSSISNTGSGNDWVGHYNIAYGNGTFVTTSSSATNNVKYSTNNGATWTAISVSGAGYSVRYIEDTSGTGYFISSSAYSTDGINWSSGVYSGSKHITDGNDLAVAVSGSGVKYYNMRETNYDPPGQLKLFYK